MKSTLPNSEKFEYWLVSEVLPAFRKTGSYSMHPEVIMVCAMVGMHMLPLLEAEAKERQRAGIRMDNTINYQTTL
jgi:prophage antirepressor-like protein